MTTTLTIRTAVAASLAALSGRTRDAVVEHFARAEAERRADAIIKGLDKLTAAERDLSKIRPQNTAFDVTGAPVGEPTFTKDQIEQRRKLDETISKLEKAISKADDSADFGDLYNLTK